MPRAFITGATGLVGYDLAHQLIERGFEVRALSRSGRLPGDLGKQVEIIRGDLGDVPTLTDAMQGAQWVFHVAADVNMWRNRWAESIRTNVTGTENMLRAARKAGVDRFIHTSTVASLGKPPPREGEPPVTIDESTTYNLADYQMVYPHTKWLAECAVEDAVAAGLDAVVTRPAMIFGPGDWKGNFLPLFKMAQKGRLGFAPRGYRTTCDVRDVALGHIQAAEKGKCGEDYVLGGECVTAKGMLDRVAAAVDGRGPRTTVPDRVMLAIGKAADAVADVTGKPPLLSSEMAVQAIFRVCASSAKAERELGYHARPLDESIRDSVRWYRDQGML